MKLIIELDLDPPDMDHTGNLCITLKDVVLDLVDHIPKNNSIRDTFNSRKPDWQQGDAKAWVLTQVRSGDVSLGRDELKPSGQILVATGSITYVDIDLKNTVVSENLLTLTGARA